MRNLNGLVRQYLPKSVDLTNYSQRDFDKIAQSLKTTPFAIIDFQTPGRVFISIN